MQVSSKCPLCAKPAAHQIELNYQDSALNRNAQFEFLRALVIDCEQCGQYAIQEVGLRFLSGGGSADFHRQAWKRIVDENNSLPENQPIFLITDRICEVKHAKLGSLTSRFEIFDVRTHLESTRECTF